MQYQCVQSSALLDPLEVALAAIDNADYKNTLEFDGSQDLYVTWQSQACFSNVYSVEVPKAPYVPTKYPKSTRQTSKLLGKYTPTAVAVRPYTKSSSIPLPPNYTSVWVPPLHHPLAHSK
jgi:hypothetical protein